MLAHATTRIACSGNEPGGDQILLGELRAARLSKVWSQRTLAERVGVDAQVIKRLEGGVGSVANLIATMEALEFATAGLGPGRTLPEQLRAHRLRSSLTLEHVAVKAKLSRATVAAVERGGGSVASVIRLLAVLAPIARRRAPERSYRGPRDKIDRNSRFTPADFMEGIYAAFGKVNLDPCGHVLSPV